MSGTGTGTALLEAARAIRPRLLADRDRIEASRRIPEDIANELARGGFFRLLLPKAYGGLDLTPMEALEVLEELARADASVAWCIWNGNTHWTAAQLPPDTARTIYADPDIITANSTRSSGKARVTPDGFRVDGQWSMVSGCELAAWMVLLCVVQDDEKPRLTPTGAPETRFMLIPSTDCEIIDTWTVGGLRGTGSHDVVVRDVFVPSSYGSGFTDPYVLPEPRYRIPPASRVIPGLGAMALGIARTAIDTFSEIAGAKIPQGATQMLRDNRSAQVRVSQAESLVRSARLFLFDSLDRLWSMVATTGEAPMETRAHVRLAASHAVSNAVQAVDLMYVGAGGSSIYATCPLERAFRDIHTITQHIGVNPRILESTGRVLFGLEPDTPLLWPLRQPNSVAGLGVQPKDGTDIILYYSKDKRPELGHYSVHEVYENGKLSYRYERWHGTRLDFFNKSPNPTHWMALPEVPGVAAKPIVVAIPDPTEPDQPCSPHK
jgi:indole-3-acetate monooxygenase